MFHVVLFEPQIPPNTGNVIRLCANTGAHLHLVKPLGYRLDDKNLRRSGLDYHELARLSVHTDFAAARASVGAARWFAIETGSAQNYTAAQFAPGDALLFGSETRGLPAAVLAQLPPEMHLSLPMLAHNRSLNLANAVAVVVYEAWRQNDFRSPA